MLSTALALLDSVKFVPLRGIVESESEVPFVKEETLYSEDEFATIDELAKEKLARSEVG